MTTTCGSTVFLAVLRARAIGRHLRKPNRPCASLLSTSKNVADPISGAGASARVRDPKTLLRKEARDQRRRFVSAMAQMPHLALAREIKAGPEARSMPSGGLRRKRGANRLESRS